MASDSRLSLGAIGQVNLNVKDLDEAIVFYRDQLGLRLIAKPGPALAFLDCAGLRLMLSASAEGNAGGNSILYFKVDEIHAAVAALAARGVQFTGEPQIIHSAAGYELWMSFFNDPAGNTLAVMDERGEYVGQS
jgi:methylmalonyl-CoA/ethylmalonyl-CoA epimerase